MSANNNKKTILDPTTVPEVTRYLEAEAALTAFKEEHPEYYERLRELTSEYNASLDAADKVLRAQEASSGPFDCYGVTKKYDLEQLYNQVGPADFARFGGTTRSVHTTEYKVDKKILEAMILSGQVPEEVVALVQSRTPTYHAPKPVSLP